MFLAYGTGRSIRKHQEKAGEKYLIQRNLCHHNGQTVTLLTHTALLSWNTPHSVKSLSVIMDKLITHTALLSWKIVKAADICRKYYLDRICDDAIHPTWNLWWCYIYDCRLASWCAIQPIVGQSGNFHANRSTIGQLAIYIMNWSKIYF